MQGDRQLPSLSATPIRRRTLLRGAFGGAAALGLAPALAACGGSDSGGGSSGGKTVVRMWSWYSDQEDQWPKLIEKFEAAHSNIKIENRVFGTPDQYLPALQAAVAGGDVPEIFAPHTRALTYGTGGVSADLKKDLGDDFLKDFFDSANQEYTLDGKQYAVGWMAQTFGLFYNPDLLKKAGVGEDEIETWDDLIAAAAKIRALGKHPVAISCNPTTSSLDFFLPLVTQVADDPTYYLKLDQLQDGLNYEDPKIIQALELNQRIVKGGVFQPGTTGTTGDQLAQIFYSEKAAMLYNGSWTPQGLSKDAPPAFAKKYKVMKTPAIAAGKRHWCANQAGAGWAVSETSKNKDAALEVLKFLYSADQYSPTMNDSNSMPATKSAAGRIELPIMKQMTSWLLDGDGCPHIPFGPGSVAAGDPLSKIFDGTGQPAAVAKEMQQAVLNAKGG
ncbi:MAG TPA: extracellular solute-binding protein [Kribbella sp.]|uniref:ABC transporter substrate-binding protein n=1 Tax=Kribbella sp. TaxID=1871183 RepID=UPI002D7981B3|nr:extracellular solute-binding protein [Kribbella sp.]HET6293264.1 extracellular solute-binding protein [Kribbella sp.]